MGQGMAIGVIAAGALAALLGASGPAVALPDVYKEYAGTEYDGKWQGTGTTRGGCRKLTIDVDVSGASIVGTAQWAPDAKRGLAASKVLGVIHADQSVELKLIKTAGNGRTSIARGLIDPFEMVLHDVSPRCPYEIRIGKAS